MPVTLVATGGLPVAIIGDAPEPAVLPKGFVAEGDSITQGAGAQGLQSYPDQVSRMLGITLVDNWGVPGERIADAIADYSEVDGSYDPDTADTLLFMMGTNDIAASRTPAQVQEDLTTYCGLAKATGYRVALGTMLPAPAVGWGSQTDRDTVNVWIRANYASIADVLVDFAAIPEMADTDDTSVYADGVHPTGLGYTYMAACAVEALGITPLAAHDDNGAPRLRVNPPYWNGASTDTYPTYSLDRMEAAFPATGANSVILEVPITTKSAFAFECVSGVGDFVGVGLQIDGVGTAAIGFGPTGSGPGYFNNGGVFVENTNPNSGLAGFTNGDIIGVCVDPVAKKIWWTKNGTDFIGIGSLASLSDVVAGLNSTAQSWPATPLGGICTFAGNPTLLARSVPYPWALPSGFSQLS